MLSLTCAKYGTVARAVVDGFISCEGCMLQLHTDQGWNFDGALFQGLCDLLQVTKTRTTPYQPCSNGQVERYNRTILAMIRCYLDKDQQNWDDDLQLLASTNHSTVNRQTCFTPNRLMHGREVLQPVDVMLGMTEANLSSLFPHAYVNHLAHTLPQLYELVRTNL